MCCCIDPPERPLPIVQLDGPNSSMKCSFTIIIVSAETTSLACVPKTFSDDAGERVALRDRIVAELAVFEIAAVAVQPADRASLVIARRARRRRTCRPDVRSTPSPVVHGEGSGVPGSCRNAIE